MEKKKPTLKPSDRRNTNVKSSFKSLGRIGKCVKCGKTLDENLHYKTQYCDSCLAVRMHEKKVRYRTKHNELAAKRMRQERVKISDRQREEHRRRLDALTKKIDPVVRRIEKGDGITVSIRGHCCGGGGCQHIPSYMSSWR